MRASDPSPTVVPTELGRASAGALLTAVATRRMATAAAGTARPAPTRETSDRRPSRAGTIVASAAAGADRAARTERPDGLRRDPLTGTWWVSGAATTGPSATADSATVVAVSD